MITAKRMLAFSLSRLLTLGVVAVLAILCFRAVNAPPDDHVKGLHMDRDGRACWVPMSEAEAERPWPGRTVSVR